MNCTSTGARAIGMLSRTFRSETATREFLRKLFLRVTPDKQIFFPGTNPAETASTESYDGQTLTLFDAGKHEMMHEVCHHLLSSPERREKVNWELGGSPFEPKSWGSLSWSQQWAISQVRDYSAVKYAADEEGDTCRLEMALARFLGCGYRRLRARMRDLSFKALPTFEDVRQLERKYPNALSSEMWVQLKERHAN